MKGHLYLVKVVEGNKIFLKGLGEGHIVSLKAKCIGKNKEVYYKGRVNFLGNTIKCNISFAPVEDSGYLINHTLDDEATVIVLDKQKKDTSNVDVSFEYPNEVRAFVYGFTILKR
jgi:nanoRNase/pAp phosphatase (c-di-AMP/oligoRNAs hydrolase)